MIMGSTLSIIHCQEISRGAQLRMETVSRHDAGLYSCIASNIIGEGDRVDIEIDVHCKLSPCDPDDLLASLSVPRMARLTSLLPRPW